MKRLMICFVVGGLMVLAAKEFAPGFFLTPRASFEDQDSRALPEFSDSPSLWLNSKPLSVASLRGKVVLLDVWTFG